MAAASGSKPQAARDRPLPPPSSWKLDSSSTKTSGSAVAGSASWAASRSASTSSNAGPMLPAMATVLPARSTSSAVIAVVVVLPLVPVMASTRGA